MSRAKKRVQWNRTERAVRLIWLRLTATIFASSVKRYNELLTEARKIALKEYERLFYEKYPHKRATTKRRRTLADKEKL